MKAFKFNFFKDCKDLSDVKNTYKNLAKINHPDRGGDVEIMKAINLEYETASKIIMKKAGFTSENFESDLLDLVAYRDAVQSIINIEGLIIELVGKWIWVSGDTKTHKDILKANGFFYASKKQSWYFRTAENKVSRSKGQSMDSIKAKYGSQTVSHKGNFLN